MSCDKKIGAISLLVQPIRHHSEPKIRISIPTKANPGAGQEEEKTRKRNGSEPGAITFTLKISRKIESENRKRESKNRKNFDEEIDQTHDLS